MPYPLLVDDDSNVLNIDRNYFESRGFSVSVAQATDQTLDRVKKYPVDYVVLNIMMLGLGGFPLCRYSRAQMTVSMIFPTNLTEEKYLYQSFSLDGDDLLTKPWGLKGLEMRVRTKISQCSNRSLRGERLEFPPLAIDVNTRQASIGNVCVPLTAYGFDILLLLTHFPGHVFSPDSIYREIWRLPDLDNTQIVEVHMARMRHKMGVACPGHNFTGTVWKQGHCFLPESS